MKSGRQQTNRLRPAAILVVWVTGLLSFATGLNGQTWDNGGNGSNWTTPNNWSPNGSPANNGTANVTFAQGNWFNSSTSTIDQAWDVNSLTLTGFLSTHTFNGQTLTIRDSVAHQGAISGATFNNDLSLPNPTTWNTNGATVITVNGQISGNGGITKTGGGSLGLAGGNTYQGTTDIAGGTLLFNADNVLDDNSSLSLSGGTLQTNGYSDTISSLTLNSSSAIDLGAGASVLEFSSVDYNGGTLTVTNYTPGQDQIRLGSNPGPLFLDQVYWADQDIQGASYQNGAIVPIPEPSTYATGIALVLIILVARWRKRRDPA